MGASFGAKVIEIWPVRKAGPEHSTVASGSEIGALGDREALQVAAPPVDCAEARPIAAAIDARAARPRSLRPGDGEMDAAAEIDAVRAVVDLDQYRERVAGTVLLARGLRHPFGRLAALFA
jgi:hypothetical protein